MQEIQDKIQTINDSRDIKIGKLYTQFARGILHFTEFEEKAKRISKDAHALIVPLLELQRGYSNLSGDITHFLGKRY